VIEIPGYEVVEHLSRSQTLDVYDVYSEARDCRCIAKTLRPDKLGDEKARDRLLNEGRLLLRLAHPHIVRAYDLIEEPDAVLILETLTGETVAHMIETSDRRLSSTDIAFLGMHVCSALHYLHSEGSLHLDVKPSNVIADKGCAKLIDMSIASPPGPGRRGVGTRQYMAPEQERGDVLTEATDVYGVGATLHEAATGIRERNGSVRTHRPRLQREIADAIDAALDPDPACRPAVRDLTDALDGALGD
jgi:eukaryotic-like serine/threonine-protein kinase